MLKEAKPEKGDIVSICDVDEFFDNKAVQEIEKLKSNYKWDIIDLDARYFAVNMQWFMFQIGLARFFRAANKNFEFVPTQRPAFCTPGPRTRIRALKHNPLFHYSLLMPLRHKLAHWGSEKGAKPIKLKWLKEIYMKWNPEDKALCNKLAAKNPTPCNGFYVNNDMGCPKQSPFLHPYTGTHPKEIGKNFINNKDFRTEN